MGFLNKLFGNTTKEGSNKIRAQYKDQKYFKDEIAFFEKMINIYKEDDQKYLQEKGSLTPSQYLSYCGKYLKIIENKYSAGDDPGSLTPHFTALIDYLYKGWSNEYQDYPLLLKAVSFNVLFNSNNEIEKKLINFILNADKSSIEDIWKPDNLIFYLTDQYDKKREGLPAYEELYNITQLPKSEAEKAIKEYLQIWYSLHKEDPWYNTHLRDKGYSGYWAWEVGAVVKKMGLDDSSFKDNPYYPYDIVHWRG